MFTEGKIYRGVLETNLLYTTIWIWEYDYDKSDGERLMYSDFKIAGDTLWPDYRDYFFCHKTTERLSKIDKLGIK
jgi:hypothetical protein